MICQSEESIHGDPELSYKQDNRNSIRSIKIYPGDDIGSSQKKPSVEINSYVITKLK